MAEKKLNIKVSTKGAKKAKQELGGVAGGLKSLGKQAIIAGGAFFAARGIINAFKSVIDAAGKQELAEKKLEAALGKTSKTLLNYASSLQKVTAFGDEATIEAMSMMAAFTKDEEALKKLTAVTLDYAAATGTDLNAAAQLVGRTFGTSMNAMSRYGVAVEGAAGSTERLESLTGNLAKMFGGQAKAQADTMSGALDQMFNALGDVAENIGESLSPLVIRLAEGIKSLATETGKEQDEARTLFNVLKDVNATEEVRERAMQAINEQYADYLPNLIDESFTLEDIERAQDRVTTAMLKRIALSVNEEKIAELMRGQLLLRDKEISLIDTVTEATKRSQAATAERERIEKDFGKHQIDFHSRLSEAKQIEIEDNKKLRLAENREEQLELQKEMNKLNMDAVELAESFSDTILKMPERPVFDLFDEEEIAILPDVIIDMQEMIDMMEDAFGKAPDGVDKSINRKIDGARELASALNMAFDPDLTGGEKMKKMGLQMLTLLESVVIAAGGVNTALTAMFTGPLGWGAIIGSLVLLEGAKAAIRNVKFAETGFEGVVNKPTLFMTGEGGRAEHVKVTPLSGGGGTSGITINISAPLVDETVIDSIIPAIQRAQRMNLA